MTLRPAPRLGFTLPELLVVVALLALLATLVVAAAATGLSRARQAHCAQQLRNLAVANTSHAAEHDRYVAAAADLMTTNRERWHGTRTSPTQPFDALRGPLARHLGTTKATACPAFRPDHDFRPGFETANGGYGYNAIGVGSTAYLAGFSAASARQGLRPAQVDTPAATLQFGDAALGQPYGRPTHLIEYSFLEPPRHLRWGSTAEATPALPSLHFRHRQRVNVVWVDGHHSAETPTQSQPVAGHSLGWFGTPVDNRPFRPW
jgi:prepilin-type N-terminal cleavage/methylation domain-containing protein/prepilin-type processing-associated H-X9-DG protein